MIEFVQFEQATVIVDFSVSEDVENPNDLAEVQAFAQRFASVFDVASGGSDGEVIAVVVKLHGSNGNGDPEVQFTGSLEQIAALYAAYNDDAITAAEVDARIKPVTSG
jgi:poly(3-hydroxybutyrate) depolymerase